jgi:endonuclease YncB( thermonuclease family)
MKRILFVFVAVFLIALSCTTWAQDVPKTSTSTSELVTSSGLIFATNPSLKLGPAYPSTTCIVDRVYDGDNVGCIAKFGRSKEARFNFRIVGIDAPEVKGHQPHWQDSRNALRALVLNQKVVIERRGFDSKWGRYTVRVYANGNDVALQQVAVGNAWYYPLYARTLTEDEKAAYQKAMDNAKASKLGIWDDAKPIKPADWRKGVRR